MKQYKKCTAGETVDAMREGKDVEMTWGEKIEWAALQNHLAHLRTRNSEFRIAEDVPDVKPPKWCGWVEIETGYMVYFRPCKGGWTCAMWPDYKNDDDMQALADAGKIKPLSWLLENMYKGES